MMGSLLAIVLLCMRCVETENPIIEPIAHGDYYIINNTSSVLTISAFGVFGIGEVALLTNEISAGTTAHIYTFTEGSGGHVMPSNAWEDFYVYSGTQSDNTIIYSGVVDSDWKEEGSNSEGHLLYYLTLE
jgi:hypothetical protein